MTFSVFATDGTGAVGIAVTSSSPAVLLSASTCAISRSPPAWRSKAWRSLASGSGRSTKGAPLRSAPGLRWTSGT